MLTIEIKINGRLIAGARVQNVSNLAAVSDYSVVAVERASEETGLGDYREDHVLRGHVRRQSVWALVERVAQRVTKDREGGL